MKKLSILFAVSLAVSATFADDSAAGASAPDSPETPIVTTLFDDGSTNTWTQADLVAALQLMNRKYHRDCQTENGRKAWHGKQLSKIADVESMESIETYEDGTVFRLPAEPPKRQTPKQPTLNAKGVPTRLAEARARRQAEKATTNIVTVVVTPDYTWELSREEVDALPPDVRRAYFHFAAERKATKKYVTPDTNTND